jgi:chromosome partitioning protein
MGLLQRFARPEYRPGAPESPAEAERRERTPAAEPETLSAPPPGEADQGGGSVHGSEGFSQEAEIGNDAPASAAASTPQPQPQPQPQPTPQSQPPPAQPEVQRADVIAFANQKGGVAKTTTTLNLAVAFAEAGHRVLAVDMDPQGNLTMSQGIDPDSVEKSMYDVLVNDVSLREVIRKREIDVACASIDLAGAEIAMSTKIGRERQLQKALRPLLEDYDFVCIDTPPSLGLLTINALTAASKVIVPVQCEYLSMRGLIQLQNTMSMIREELNPDIEIEGILPTLVDSRTVHAKEAIEILEENFGDRVFATRIRKTIRFAEAPVKGTSVLKYDPDGVAAESYRELAKEVLANGRR